MARHPKQADYERTARNRAGLRLQATMLGWTPLDTLSAFLTVEGDIIVIDKALNRYATTGEAEQLTSPEATTGSTPLVEPMTVSGPEFGTRWQAGRVKIGSNVAGLDLTTADRATALSLLEQLAAVSLRGVELLRENTGPDWREAIGLSTEES